MRETKAARAAVEMTSREREMNGRTLRMLQENQVLREAIRYAVVASPMYLLPRSRMLIHYNSYEGNAPD